MPFRYSLIYLTGLLPACSWTGAARNFRFTERAEHNHCGLLTRWAGLPQTG